MTFILTKNQSDYSINNNNQKFKERKMRDRKMNQQKMQLNYNKNYYIEQKKTIHRQYY